jgi:molybdopterin synthase sulfur carrier subunit
MTVRVKLPTQLRALAGGASEVEVEGASSVKELLDALGRDHPELVERVIDDEGGGIRRFINVYVGDEDVRFMNGVDTEIEDGATVSILPAVAGGGSDRLDPPRDAP